MNSAQSVVNDAHRETDRACALVLSADLENRLKDLLQSYLVDLPDKQNKELYSGYGPLATFSSRITMSFSVGLISKHELNDLKLIKKVRNRFAHAEGSLQFKDKLIKNWCIGMEISKALKKQTPELKDPRSLYMATASILSLEILTKTKNAKNKKRTTPLNMRIEEKS